MREALVFAAQRLMIIITITIINARKKNRTVMVAYLGVKLSFIDIGFIRCIFFFLKFIS